MANASEVRLILNAVDNASAKINGVTTSVSKLGKITKGASDMLAGMGVNIGSASMIAGQALNKVIDVTKQAVQETVAYNKQIREMTQVTGLGAEEISRIVQVGDDWGISIETLRTSLAFMNKSGVTPSIDNLAKLADEYVNTEDKSAFAEKAVKLLGRGYQTLIPLLALGGKGLRDATGAVEENLIATDKSIASAREYEVNVDKLTDAWMGFKQEVGNKVIPVLNEVLGGLNDQKDISAELRQAWKDGIITQKEYAEGLRDLRTGGEDYLDTINKIVTASADEYRPEMNRLTYDMGLATDATNDMADATNRAAMSIIDLSKAAFAQEAIKELSKAYEAGTILEENYNAQMTDLMQNWLDLPQSTIEATLALQDLKENQLGPGALLAEDYANAVRHIFNELKNLDGTTAHTTIITQTEYRQGSGRHHSGGSFVIPPGYPNDSFPLGAGHYGESGEVVTVTPTNNITKNYTMNVHTNAQSSSLMRDFNTMKAMAD